MAFTNYTESQLHHDNTTKGEKKVAKVLQKHLSDDALIWLNPLIPPSNLEPDFMVFDPSRGYLVIEVKDWKIQTIESATNNEVVLNINGGSKTSKNPYRQVKDYSFAIKERLETAKSLVHPPEHRWQGKLIMPYGLVVILTNITRSELQDKNLEAAFGSESVFCKDEFFQDMDSELFQDKLWSVLPFRLRERLHHNKVNTFYQKLGISIKDANKIELNDELETNSENNLTETVNNDNVHTNTVEEPVSSTIDINSAPQELNNPATEENLISQNTESENIGKSTTREKKLIPIGFTALIALPTVLMIGYMFAGRTSPTSPTLQQQTVLPSESKNNTTTVTSTSSMIEADSITVGIVSYSDNYAELVNHLRDRLGDNVKVVLEGNDQTPYQEAKDKIARKEWDIAFALSPMISVAAKDNGYTWAARMFPNYPPFYQSALFVRADSSIYSLKDLTPEMTIALGDFNSASSFYMPSYDLYGKSMKVDLGNRGSKIIELVKNGDVEVGAAAYGKRVSEDSNLRIIHLSRNIPSSGVFLSPKLSERDRQTIAQILAEVPEEIKEKANYGKTEEAEIDYSNFREIVNRVEEVLGCSDWYAPVVDFYCGDRSVSSLPNSINQNSIVGQVNGVTRINQDTVVLKMKGNDQRLYKVTVSPQLLNRIPGAGSAINLQNKQIRLVEVEPTQLDNGNWQVQISQPSQINVL